MKKIKHILAIIIFLLSSDIKANDCKSIDSLLSNIVIAIADTNIDKYSQLINEKKTMQIYKELSTQDDDIKFIYNRFLEKPEYFEIILIKPFEKLIFNLQSLAYDVKFDRYKIINIENTLPNLKHLELKVFLISNGKKINITVYLSKYKGCYYILDPIYHIHHEGWE